MANEECQNQIDAIFLAALDVPGSGRDAFLQANFGHAEPEVLRRVQELLSLDKGATEAYLTANPHLKLGQVLKTEVAGVEEVGNAIGKYHLLQKLGEGGMGVVYVAEQREPVKRRVALKVIKPGMDSKSVVARFEAERQALAMMEHPNIAQVLDAGMTDSGRPYIVMELVNGVPITSYCDENRLTIAERLILFESICQAVHHAHQKGIIHRDLKPSNVLVAEYDDVPAVKVIDFGLAKALQHTLTEKTLYTRVGQIVGTYEYMSPEQAKLNQLDIDTRTDIYSLGVLLYELLSGHTPFDSQTLREKAFDEMLRVIREDDPPRPSLKLTNSPKSAICSASRKTDSRKLQSTISGDLDAIVMKSLSKERSRRYESSSEFAKDIRRFLDGNPVVAQPPSLFYIGKKFLRRQRVVMTAALLLLLSILIGLTSTSILAIRNQNLYTKEQAVRREAERGEYVSSVHSISYLLGNGASNGVREILDEAPEELRGWEWGYLNRVYMDAPVVREQEDYIENLVCSPDGTWFATIDAYGKLHIWDMASRERQDVIEIPTMVGDNNRLLLSPNNRHLVFCGDAQLYIVDISNREYRLVKLPPEFEPDDYQVRWTFSQPDGNRIMVSHTAKSTFIIVDVLEGIVIEHGTTPAGSYGCRYTRWPNIALSSLTVDREPDGKLKSFLLWNLSDGSHHDEILVETEAFEDFDIRIGPSGQRYVTFNYRDNRLSALTFYEFETKEKVWELDLTSYRKGYSRSRFRFSPDDSMFITPLANGSLVGDIRSRETTILRGHGRGSRGVGFPSKDQIITSGLDRRICFWGTTMSPDYFDWPANASTAAFSPQGDILASVGASKAIRLWSYPSLRLQGTLLWPELNPSPLRHLVFSPDGRFLAVGSSGTVRIWQIATKRLVATKYISKGQLDGLRYSADGGHLIALHTNGECSRIATDTMVDELVATYKGHAFALAVSPSGRWIAIGGRSGELQLVDTTTGNARIVGDSRVSILTICFDREEQFVACGGHDQLMTIYDLATGEPPVVLPEYSKIRRCRFFPGDKKRFVSAAGKDLKIWDLNEREPVLTFNLEMGFRTFAVHPTADTLIAALSDGNLRFWDRDTTAYEQLRERRVRKYAVFLVERQFENHLHAAKVREQIKQSQLDARTESEALAYLDARGDQLHDMLSQAQETVFSSKEDEAAYEDALHNVVTALRQLDEAPECESLLGMAQFRTDRLQEAVATLRAAQTKLEQIPLMPKDQHYAEKQRNRRLTPRANNLAFLYFALTKLNHDAEAAELLARFKADSELLDSVNERIIDESEVLQSLLQEAKMDSEPDAGKPNR